MNSKSPLVKTVIDVPKSVRNALGNKKWVLMISIREFGTTSNSTAATVKAEKQKKQRNRKINAANKRTQNINTGFLEFESKPKNGNTGKKPVNKPDQSRKPKARKPRTVGQKRRARNQPPRVGRSMKPASTKSKQMQSKVKEHRNDMMASAHQQDNDAIERKRKRVEKLKENYTKQELLEGSLGGEQK